MQQRKETIPSDSYVDSLYMLTVFRDDKNKARLDKRAQVMLMTIDKKFPTFVTDYQRRFSQTYVNAPDLLKELSECVVDNPLKDLLFDVSVFNTPLMFGSAG